jgi:hypothetical protein
MPSVGLVKIVSAVWASSERTVPTRKKRAITSPEARGRIMEAGGLRITTVWQKLEFNKHFSPQNPKFRVARL